MCRAASGSQRETTASVSSLMLSSAASKLPSLISIKACAAPLSRGAADLQGPTRTAKPIGPGTNTYATWEEGKSEFVAATSGRNDFILGYDPTHRPSPPLTLDGRLMDGVHFAIRSSVLRVYCKYRILKVALRADPYSWRGLLWRIDDHGVGQSFFCSG